MDEIEKRLILLTKFWYDYVACDYHKDKDCHFYIHKKWSYGREPVYAIEHYGYMTELEWTEYPTYSDALTALVEWLEGEVKGVYESIPADYQDTSKWDYNWGGVMKVCLRYDLYPLVKRVNEDTDTTTKERLPT